MSPLRIGQMDTGPKPAPVTDGLLYIGDLTGYIVYCLYDIDDNLLYVGQTQDLANRLGAHRRIRAYGPRIHHVRYQQLRTYDDMLTLEAELIRTLHPTHNSPKRRYTQPTPTLQDIAHSHKQALKRRQTTAAKDPETPGNALGEDLTKVAQRSIEARDSA